MKISERFHVRKADAIECDPVNVQHLRSIDSVKIKFAARIAHDMRTIDMVLSKAEALDMILHLTHSVAALDGLSVGK
jgi:hypothetical protein